MGITFRKVTALGSVRTGYVPPTPPPPDLWDFNFQYELPPVGGPGAVVIWPTKSGEGDVWRIGDTVEAYPVPGATLTVIGDLGSYPVLDAAFDPSPSEGDSILAIRQTGDENTPISIMGTNVSHCIIFAPKKPGNPIQIGLMRNYDFSSAPAALEVYPIGGSGWVSIGTITSTFTVPEGDGLGNDMGFTRYFNVPYDASLLVSPGFRKFGSIRKA